MVHLAWAIQPARSPTTQWSTNVVGTQRLLDAAVRAGVGTVVHASSLGAYSPAPKDRRIDESWPTDGVATLHYSWQKSYVERVLDLLERDRPDLRVVRLRPALIMQRQAARSLRLQFLSPLVPTALVPVEPSIRAVERLPVPFQVIHAVDVAAAYVAAVVGDARGPFNVAAEPVLGRLGAGARPMIATARFAADVAWRTRLMRGDPAWIDQLAVAPLLDCSRARAELGWAPTVDGRDALREVLEGWKRGGTASSPPPADGPLLRRDPSRPAVPPDPVRAARRCP